MFYRLKRFLSRWVKRWRPAIGCDSPMTMEAWANYRKELYKFRLDERERQA